MKISNLNISTLKENKQIVKNLSLELKKGELLAILGPSGSGKTTLLDYLSTRVRSNLTYDGDCRIEGHIKYVSQEDQLHGFYTVRQYLDLYVSLNYGRSLPNETRESIIQGVADETGLTGALDTRVGDIFLKGISGGQKRRLSIALELIGKPDVLILDEPTSGLDSYSSFSIIEILKKLTREGIIVVCTLHQPSSEIWMMLDKILLLSNGYNCFYGHAKDAEDFFKHIGKELPNNYNPGDFYIGHINHDFGKDINPSQISKDFSQWSMNRQDPYVDLNADEIKSSDVRQLILKINNESDCLDKFWTLLKRSIYNLIMNPGIIMVRLVMYMMLTAMIGLQYRNLGLSFNHQDIISRTSLLFFVDAFLVFMSIAVLPFFLIERAIIEKEIHNKVYHPFYYQISMFIMAIPGTALIAIFSTILVVLIAQLNGFGIFFLTLFLSLLVAESLCRLVAMLVPHYIIGMALVAGLYGMFMLCEGFLIVKSDIPGYFIWIYYLAFHTYGFQAFMFNEFSSISYFSSYQFPNGYEVLRFYNMDEVAIWKNMIILVGFSLGFEVVLFIVMALKFRRNSHSQKTKAASVAINSEP